MTQQQSPSDDLRTKVEAWTEELTRLATVFQARYDEERITPRSLGRSKVISGPRLFSADLADLACDISEVGRECAQDLIEAFDNAVAGILERELPATRAKLVRVTTTLIQLNQPAIKQAPDQTAPTLNQAAVDLRQVATAFEYALAGAGAIQVEAPAAGTAIQM